jgi:hypothetical protein
MHEHRAIEIRANLKFQMRRILTVPVHFFRRGERQKFPHPEARRGLAWIYSASCHDGNRVVAYAADKSNAGGTGKRETLISPELPPRNAAANMNASSSLPQRKIFGRLSIVVGNMLQIAGIVAACAAFALARSARSKPAATAILMMIAAWLLLYFFCHGIAHWAVGRLLGIRFAFYTIGGTGNPEGYPTGMRWVFEHLPFFGVQTDKA